MNQLKRSVLVLVLCCAVVSPGMAQFHLSLQPVTGLNFNIHGGSDLKETGTGIGLMIGGDAVMTFSPTIGLISGLRFYDNRSGSTSTTGTEQGVNFTQDNSASLAYFQLENLFMLKLAKSQLYFVAGPVLGFNVEAQSEVTTNITTPGVQFPGGGTSQKVKNSIKNTLVRFELKMGAGYEIPISRQIVLVPQLSFGYGISKVVEDVSWRIMTFQAQVGARFSIM